MDHQEHATPAKQPRKRTKGLLKKLQEQIEFYFGDANLPKDKFLQQKISEHPDRYISVEVIASFNKMKSLTTDISLIIQAMQKSSLVELSEDHVWVRRSTPLPEASDVDLRTIYVENLPVHSTDHNLVKRLFKMFGSVTYVSLPRHKVSGTIKGFAFVEFSAEDEAKAAVEYFQCKSKLPQTLKSSTSCGKDSQRTSTSGGMEEGEEKGREKEGKEEKEKKRKEEGREETDKEGLKRKRRRTASLGTRLHGCDAQTSKGRYCRRDSEQSDNKGDPNLPECTTERHQSMEIVSDKRQAPSTGQEKQLQQVEVSERQGCELEGAAVRTESRKRKRGDETGDEVTQESLPSTKSARIESQSSEMGDDGVGSGEGVEGGRKKRNRQHKKKDWSVLLNKLGLRVIAKTEWLEMKKMYRDLQKGHMKQLKEEQGRGGGEEEGGKGKGFVSQCLVRVECEGEEEVTCGQLREVCSKYGDVAFVGSREESKEFYVRYRTSGCVQSLVENEHLPGVTFSPVEEEEERAYYLETQAARKQQWKLKGRGKMKQRGQDRVIAKALKKREGGGVPASHIRFSGDSDTEDS